MMPDKWSLTQGVNWDVVTPDELRQHVALLLESYIADQAQEESSVSVEGFAMYIPWAHGWDAAYRWIYAQQPKEPLRPLDVVDDRKEP